MSMVDSEQRNEIERMLYIQVLDENWREHLYQMDILKTGIGLRGYNQKDPLVEYKKESFSLFNELIERVKTEYMKVIHSLQLNYEEEPTPDFGEIPDEVLAELAKRQEKLERKGKELSEEEIIKAIEEFNKELEKDFVEKKVHPMDVETALAKEISRLLTHIKDSVDEKLIKEAYPC